MSSWKIDPLTGDYLMEKGAPVDSDSLTIPAYYRLKTKRTKWLYAPDTNFGSDLYLIQKNDPSLVERSTADALQPIVDDGRANAIDIETTARDRNGLGLQVKIEDAGGKNETIEFKGLGV